MVRLIIFLGPIAASLCGIAVGYAVDDLHDLQNTPFDTWRVNRFCSIGRRKEKADERRQRFQHENEEEAFQQQHVFFIPGSKKQGFLVNDPRRALSKIYHSNVSSCSFDALVSWPRICHQLAFVHEVLDMAQGMSMPSVMFKGQLQDGRVILVRDYMDAYEWVRETSNAGSWPGGITLPNHWHRQPC